MRSLLSGSIGMSFLIAVLTAPVHAQSWKMQYQYDELKSTLGITDLQFASPTRGVAVGVIHEGRKEKPVAIVTSDGGAHWQLSEIEDTPISLFFLNETSGWLVTDKGLMHTTEAGKSWRKLPKPPTPLFRVYFLDEKTGWAAGPKKAAYETHDGGEHWKVLPAASEQPGDKDTSAYSLIAFATPMHGIISGWNTPRRRFASRFPDWMDPEAAVSRRELPHLVYSLTTVDGGKTWKSASASVFGLVTRVRFSKTGGGVGLIEYEGSFRYPSEVYRIDWTSGKNTTVYRDSKTAVTDLWLSNDGAAYLAGYRLPGQLRSVVPGKVQVLRTTDFKSWSDMPVDYRANATHVILAAAGDQNLWIATDTGMILKMTP